MCTPETLSKKFRRLSTTLLTKRKRGGSVDNCHTRSGYEKSYQQQNTEYIGIELPTTILGNKKIPLARKHLQTRRSKLLPQDWGYAIFY